MSEVNSKTHHKLHAPNTILLSDYKPPAFLIDQTHLQFFLEEENTLVVSTLSIRRNSEVSHENQSLELNGESLLLKSVLLDGRELTHNEYTVTDFGLLIHQVPDQFELQTKVEINPKANTELSGLYLSRGKFCTQCEAEGFRRITYYLDRPDVLSLFKTEIIADQKLYPYLLSNGNLIHDELLENGKRKVIWEDPFKKPSYLFALVAGAFESVKDEYVTQSGRKVSLELYVELGYADYVSHAMFSVKKAFEWDEKAYGREYDLDVYMIVAINDFNMGAMENKGLNIFNTKYILANPKTATDDDYLNILSVIGHEYFHNWSGNRVTCRDWFQLSLKEGLTIFRDQSFSEDVVKSSVIRIRDVCDLRENQFLEDAGPLAHPVQPKAYMQIDNFYTSTIYNKGAEVLRMMQTILGRDQFRKGMDLYFERHDGCAVTIEDFVQAMEDVSHRSLSDFKKWYHQAGTPVVTIEDHYDEFKYEYRITLVQSIHNAKVLTDNMPLTIPVKLGLINELGDVISYSLNGNKNEAESVMLFDQFKQDIILKEVVSRPIPSLFRNFSAPVSVVMNRSLSDYLLLFKHDTDPFNQYEAGQTYLIKMMLDLIKLYQNGEALHFDSHYPRAIQYLLTQPSKDLFHLAELLTVPSERYLAQQMKVVDVDAIHAVRQFVMTELATQLTATWESCYEQYNHHQEELSFDLADLGRRQLRNRCLSYLAYLPQYAEMIKNELMRALSFNMTIAQSTLAFIVQTDSPYRLEALSAFYEAYQHDPLVLDKWFAIQAAAPLDTVIPTIRSLMNDPAFDIKNPNKVYALIGTFGHRNLKYFHDQSGDGYALLAEVVEQLDSLNPQVAARMVIPLTTWQRYDKERQQLMINQLVRLSKNASLSTDLYEIISKSLAGVEKIDNG